METWSKENNRPLHTVLHHVVQSMPATWELAYIHQQTTLQVWDNYTNQWPTHEEPTTASNKPIKNQNQIKLINDSKISTKFSDKMEKLASTLPVHSSSLSTLPHYFLFFHNPSFFLLVVFSSSNWNKKTFLQKQGRQWRCFSLFPSTPANISISSSLWIAMALAPLMYDAFPPPTGLECALQLINNKK